ncbi:MAG TPA: PfkB family carbohydrate kinase [Solirubrobacteraceae bacterium]|nr:PfkB family carbohydrate kinase [Solirubrobacteraceae bacterium]
MSGTSPDNPSSGGANHRHRDRERGRSGDRADPPPGAPTLCLGEALVDFICERPLDDVALGDAFVPHFGGSVANVAVIAARQRAHVALAGGVGDDAWGRWLRDRLEREGVGVSMFELTPGAPTPVALVAVSRAGEPSYQIYGDTIATAVQSLGGRLEPAIEGAAGLYFSSNTLVGADEREVTMRARAAALELGRPIVFDANLRLHRWRSRAEAAAAANACVPGALLVRANAEEAAVMTGEDDLERAALALVKAGARMVVITLGPDGAILRGELRLDVPGRPAAVVSTIGAGDVLTGTLLARLASSAYYPSAVAAALPEAVAQSSLACERWGALE